MPETEGTTEPPRTIGRYQILEVIGIGGMGTVYKGLQPSLNRVVAIKVLPRTFASDPELRERFLRESQAIASLSHPHIIQVIDRGEEGGMYYFVMEHVDGPSLEAVLKGGRLPLPAALDIFSQVCQAVEYAHGRGVIHRDLKPSNILLSRNRKVAKVADFGIARLTVSGGADSTITQPQKSLGTLNYMSPEQRTASGKIDQRADIYSLGVVFYQMLTGKLPIGSFPLPSHCDREISPWIDQIVLKCLQPEPGGRYQSLAYLLEDLEVERVRTLHLREELKTAFSRLRRLTRSSPAGLLRERRPLVLAGGLGALVAVGAVLWFVFGSSGKPLLVTRLAPAVPGTLPKKMAYIETMIQNGMTSQALVELKEIVEQHQASPSAADAQMRIAQLRETLGQHEEAEAEYLKTMTIFPQSPRAPEAAYLMAMMYLHKTGDEKKAQAVFRTVYDRFPRSAYAPRALFQLAQLLKESSRNFIEQLFTTSNASDRKAAEILEKLLQEYPRSEEAPAVLIELGRLYDPDHLDQPAKSNEYFDLLRQRYPKTTFPVDYYRAVNYEALGQKHTARELYRNFLASNPTGPEARSARAKLEKLE